MNFGETLAYWYFRLNGFLPLSNFVLHRPEKSNGQNADSDILAVRFPHVFEEIGGQPNDWDCIRFANWNLDYLNRTVFLVAEIKTGRFSKASIDRAFSKRRVLYALRRFGVIPLEQCKDVGKRLSDDSVVHHGDYCFAKLLVCSTTHRARLCEDATPHLRLEFSDALAFIRERMNRYRDPKTAARMFFSGDLIQFLAWESGIVGDPITSGIERSSGNHA